MSPAAVLATLLMGGVAGALSGLVGVGGGVLMVPFLYFLLSASGWSGIEVPAAHHAVVAHATSLFVIVPTAVAGIVAYRKARLVEWSLVIPLAAGAAVGAAVGTRLAVEIPSPALKAAFGVLLVAAGIRLLWSPGEGMEGEERSHPALTLSCGVVVGVLSALLGVGGGVVAIPILIYILKLGMERVAASSIAIVLFAASVGTLGYVFGGWGMEELPSGSLGFVFAPAGLALIPGAVVAVGWGARLNQRMNVRALRLLFALVFLALGLRLAVVNGLAVLSGP